MEGYIFTPLDHGDDHLYHSDLSISPKTIIITTMKYELQNDQFMVMRPKLDSAAKLCTIVWSLKSLQLISQERRAFSMAPTTTQTN